MGTANTLIIYEEEVVVNEPSIVALSHTSPKHVVAVGKMALILR